MSGFLIVFLYIQISANDPVPVKILSDFFIKKTDHSPPIANDKLIDLSCSYSPLLKERRRSDNDRFNSFLEFMNFSGSLTLGNSKLQSKTTYAYDSYCGAVRIDNSTYGSFSSQHTHRINSLLWYSIKCMNFGMQLGTIIPANNDISINNNRITDYARSGLLQYGLQTDLTYKYFNLLLYAEKQPIHFGITRLIKNNQPDHFLSFPTLLINHSIGISLKYSSEPLKSNVDLSVSKIQNDRKIHTKMQMPINLNLNIYSLYYEGKTCYDLAWAIRMLTSGGWCSGHSNSFDGMNYFLANSLRIKSLHTFFGLKDSLRHTLLLEGGILVIKSPEGFLNLAPFSEWTILCTQAYRYNECRLKYFEAGFTAAKHFLINKFNVDLHLSAFLFSTYGKYNLSKKVIFVLLLKYKDMGEKRIWDEKGILFQPQISIPVNTRAIDFNFSINGIIPVSFHKKKTGSGQNTKSGPSEMTGGIKAALRVSLKRIN